MSEKTVEEKMAIWNALERTPEEFLKNFKRGGGFSGKSVDPTYRIKRLTELFGPCGIGWLFVQEDSWIVEIGGSHVAFVRGHLKYKVNGEWVQTSSHTGGTVCDRTPDEAYKMSETDACGKCCLDIGLASDVYLGHHDGDKYQATQSQGAAPRQTVAPHQQSAAPVADPVSPVGGWRAWKVPIGKNQGKTLGELNQKSLEWYIENFTAKQQYPDSVAFRNALDEAKSELGV